MSVRALIYVQHLLGIGHLARVNRIAAGCAAAGIETTIVRGGVPTSLPEPDGVRSIQLPPVKVAAEDMSLLLHADGRSFTAEDQADRRSLLLDALANCRPDIVLTEAYPFGRRQMRFELVPFIEAARAGGVRVIAPSVRDLLQESRKPGRAEETVAVIDRWFDLVLVHGDAARTPLSLTFPAADRIAQKLRYTGLVGPPVPTVTGEARRGVVVSAGGGSVGYGLLEAAIAAASTSPLGDEPWLVLTGPNLPDEAFGRLRAKAAESTADITVMRSVPDLAARLAGARLSISQAGYNTVADILAAGCRAVLTPFAAGGETEQTARAQSLALAGRAIMLPEDDLSTIAIARAAAAALALPSPRPEALPGAANTAAILLETLSQQTSAQLRLEPAGPVVSSQAGGHS